MIIQHSMSTVKYIASGERYILELHLVQRMPLLFFSCKSVDCKPFTLGNCNFCIFCANLITKSLGLCHS